MDKHPLQSKTVWGALVFVVVSIYSSVTGDTTAVTEVLKVLGLGGSVYGLRDAVK